MKIRDKTNNDVYEMGRYISVLIKNEDKDEYYTMEFTSIKDLTDTLEDYEEPKATFKDIVLGTPVGKEAMKEALKKSCEDQVGLLEESKRRIEVEQARDLGIDVKVDIYHSIIDFSKIRLPVVEIHRKVKDCGKTEAELIISLDQKTGVLTYRVLNKELGYDFVYTPHEFNFVAWKIIGEDK